MAAALYRSHHHVGRSANRFRSLCINPAHSQQIKAVLSAQRLLRVLSPPFSTESRSHLRPKPRSNLATGADLVQSDLLAAAIGALAAIIISISVNATRFSRLGHILPERLAKMLKSPSRPRRVARKLGLLTGLPVLTSVLPFLFPPIASLGLLHAAPKADDG